MQPIESGYSWTKATLETVLRFLRRPTEQIKHMPDWAWGHLILVQVVVAAGSGALGGLLDEKILLSIFLGLILSPILTLIPIVIATIYFYYVFQIFAERELSHRQIATVVMFASLPQTLLQIFSGFVPLVSVVGMAITALLLIIGLVDNFQLPRKLVIRLVVSLYVAFVILWGAGQLISKNTMDREFQGSTLSH